MFWLTVGRILWARRLIIAIVTLGALAGGGFIAATADRQYDATARVMLTLYKPDPITGMIIGRRQIDPYLQSQLSFVRDIQVVAPAVEAIGWLDNPEVLAMYNDRPATDQRPLLIWLAQSVAVALDTSLVEGSNIIEIRYRGSSPELAALVAGAVRDAYIAGNVRDRRASAEEDAANQAARAERLRQELLDLQARKRALETETGVMLTPAGADVDAESLLALAGPPPKGAQEPIQAVRGSARARLAELDAEITMAAQALGPNHPRLVEARSMRNLLVAQAAAEERDSGGVGAAVVASERAKAAALDRQRLRVLDQRPDALRVRLVQDQINLKAAALEAALERVAFTRQLTTTTESGTVSIGDVKNIPGVSFPNIPLILGGTGGLGLIGGILAALLVEMFNLRVRTLGGLRIAATIPVLCVMPDLDNAQVRRRRRRLFTLPKLKPAAA